MKVRTVYLAINDPKVEGWFRHRFGDLEVKGSGVAVAEIMADVQVLKPDLLLAAGEYRGVGVPDLKTGLGGIRYWSPETRILLLVWDPAEQRDLVEVAAGLGITDVLVPPPGGQLRPEAVEEAVLKLFPPEPSPTAVEADPWGEWGGAKVNTGADAVPPPTIPPMAAAVDAPPPNPWDAPAPGPAIPLPSAAPKAPEGAPARPPQHAPAPTAVPPQPAAGPWERQPPPPTGNPAPGGYPWGPEAHETPLPGGGMDYPQFPGQEPMVGGPGGAPPPPPKRGGLLRILGGGRRKPDFAPPPTLPDPGSVVSARLVAVVGAKGGVGKTVIAAGLAALGARMRISTAAIDLDSENSDLSLEFGSPGDGALSALGRECLAHQDLELRLRQPPSQELVRKTLVNTKAGVALLTGMEHGHVGCPHDRAWLALTSHVVRILTSLFQLTVADCGSLLDAPLPWGALEHANAVVVACGNESKDLRDLERTLAALGNGGVPRERCLLAVTRYRDGVGLSPMNMSRVVGVPLSAVFPDDRTAYVTATQGGRPLSLSDPPRGPWHKLLSDVYAAALPPEPRALPGEDYAPGPRRRGVINKLLGG